MSIFEYSDFREYLRTRVRERITDARGRKRSNITRVARELGYSSPSLLSMVLNGRRVPSEEFCAAFTRQWKLSLREGEYLRLLVELERRKQAGEDNAPTLERLRRLAGRRTALTFRDHEFAAVREWHYLAIRHLARTPQFRDDPHWISQALRKKISSFQARVALERMEELGILQRSVATGRLEVPAHSVETTHDLPSASIRLHHRGMIQRALEALEERPAEERGFLALTFNLDPRRLPELKARLLEFLRGIDEEFHAPAGPAVAQLNLQLFEHTQELGPPGPKGPHAIH